MKSDDFSHNLTLCLALVTLGAMACRSPTAGLPDTPGRFALVAVNGKPLPAVVDTSALDYGAVIADTITIDGRGGASRAFVFRRVSAVSGRDDLYHPRFTSEYRRGPGARFEIGRFTPCPINALCVANDDGVELPGGLELTGHRYGYALRLTFIRLAD